MILTAIARSGRSTVTRPARAGLTRRRGCGAFAGPSLGGMLLALGGFPLVGLFSLAASVLAAVVIRLKVRDPAAFREGHHGHE